MKTFANSLESCKHALEEFYTAVHLRVVGLAKRDLQYPGAGLTIEDCTNCGNPLCDVDDLTRVTELVNRCIEDLIWDDAMLESELQNVFQIPIKSGP